MKKPLDKAIQIDEAQVRGHLDEMLRSTAEVGPLPQALKVRFPLRLCAFA